MLDDSKAHVRTLRGFVYGLKFFAKRGYSIEQLQVLCTIKMLCLHRPNQPPTLKEIVVASQLTEAEVDLALECLEENALVHREIPTYGDLARSAYRLKAKGGSMVKRMLNP